MQPSVHYRVHNSPAPILSTINPFYALSFPTKILYALFSPVRATRPAHLIFLDFMAQIISGDENKSRSSSLYRVGQSSFIILIYVVLWRPRRGD